jgi:hypothetical protein
MTEPRSNHPEFCQFAFSDNRQCRMLRHENHASLCLFHAHAEHQLLESHRLGAEMAATFTGDFLTAADINHVMGKVFTALAQNRIPQRTAATLAYLGQVMLLSLPMAKNETKFRLLLRNLDGLHQQRHSSLQLPATLTRNPARHHRNGVTPCASKATARTMLLSLPGLILRLLGRSTALP